MNNINKYLKIVKKAEIEPTQDIEKKIIDRITSLSDSDSLLLDDKLMDYLRKYNSRLYIWSERLKNNSGKALILSSFTLLILIFLIIGLRRLPSSKNSS